MDRDYTFFGSDTSKAVREYRNALQVYPDAAKLHLELGKALAQEGQAQQARAQWRQILTDRGMVYITAADKGIIQAQAQRLIKTGVNCRRD